MDSRPIGIFDSGLGGLTVVKSIRTLLPNESILYFGDTARVPYGNKSKELIKEHSYEITEFLVKKDVKLVLVRNPLYFEYDNKGIKLTYLDAISVTFLLNSFTISI